MDKQKNTKPKAQKPDLKAKDADKKKPEKTNAELAKEIQKKMLAKGEDDGCVFC